MSLVPSGWIPFIFDILGVPSTRVPIGVTALWYLFPPVVGYLIAAVLAVKPQTRGLRAALWPVVALLALRAAVSVDMSHGRPEHMFLNVNLVLVMFMIATRTLDWTLSQNPLVRQRRPANSAPSTTTDALDLAFNFRGLGWNWSRGLHVAPDTRPAGRIPFVLYVILSLLVHTWIYGAVHRVVVTLAPAETGPFSGGSSIFDESLPFLWRYLRAVFLSAFASLTIYSAMQTSYDASTIPAVLLLGQGPAQWPPLFQAPWFATSLSDFWGRRWHQLFRRTFIFIGGYPLSHVFGRTGIILGAFLVSGIYHHIVMSAFETRKDLEWMFVGFGAMGPGILLERAFEQLTGRKVGGVIGWVWTMAWLAGWGTPIMDGFARAGMFGRATFVDSLFPARAPVEHLAIALDRWLHTI